MRIILTSFYNNIHSANNAIYATVRKFFRTEAESKSEMFAAQIVVSKKDNSSVDTNEHQNSVLTN